MLDPDLTKGRRFVDAHAPPGRLLLCGVTGSHFYGFPSPDSDLDLKGIHLAPTAELLGLGAPQETFDRLLVFEGLECDYTSHEARKALSLLLRGNGNMLERILSPIQLQATEELRALQALARATISKRFASHYRGFFQGMCREHDRSEAPRAKTLLYAYRVALTGVHLLRTGELVGDVNETAPRYGFEAALELVARKRDGEERVVLTAAEDATHRGAWPALEAALASALEESTLPDAPDNAAEPDAFLVELRPFGETW